MALKRDLKHRLVFGLMALCMIAAAGMTQEPPDATKPIENLQFQSAEIRSVLTFLADYGGVNVVVAPGVEGSVTIKLNNVKWREAMDIVGRTYGLAVVEEESGYIRILDAKEYRTEVSEMDSEIG